MRNEKPSRLGGARPANYRVVQSPMFPILETPMHNSKQTESSLKPSRKDRPVGMSKPCLIVAGDFTPSGGMDRPNYEWPGIWQSNKDLWSIW